MGKFIDLTGQRFGRLVVVERVEKPKNVKRGTFWECGCDCGNKKITTSKSLKNGDCTSCGCYGKEQRKKALEIDITGLKFNKLFIIRSFYKKYGNRQKKVCECLCDCGNIKIISQNSIVCGTTKSCGCAQIENGRIQGKKRKGLVRNDLRLPNTVSQRNNLYRTYIKGASRRGLLFELGIDIFDKITKENCWYCGAAPSQIKKSRYGCGDYIYNGIDRIDSSKGYTIDNVVPCCGRCNVMKMVMGQQEFLDHIEKIYNYQKEKNNEL